MRINVSNVTQTMTSLAEQLNLITPITANIEKQEVTEVVLKQYMVTLIMLLSLVIFSCGIEVSSTAPELTETIKKAIEDEASPKTDEALDVRTVQADTEATANVEQKNKQEKKQPKCNLERVHQGIW